MALVYYCDYYQGTSSNDWFIVRYGGSTWGSQSGVFTLTISATGIYHVREYGSRLVIVIPSLMMAILRYHFFFLAVHSLVITGLITVRIAVYSL